MAKNSKGSILVPVILLGGAAAFAVWAATGVKLQKLEIAFRSFSTDIKFYFPNLNVPVNIEIKNPNKTPLTFEELNCDVLINNTKVTVLKYIKPIVLQPNSTTTIKKVLIQTEIFTAVDKALDFINKSVSIQMKGYLKANKLSYPIDTSIQIS